MLIFVELCPPPLPLPLTLLLFTFDGELFQPWFWTTLLRCAHTSCQPHAYPSNHHVGLIQWPQSSLKSAVEGTK